VQNNKSIEGMRSFTERTAYFIALHQEKLVEAFIAEIGCPPSECEMVVSHNSPADTVISVRRRLDLPPLSTKVKPTTISLSTHRLQLFLYILLCDHLTFGDAEIIMEKFVRMVTGTGMEITFSNPFLADYVKSLAEELARASD
jgi:hypothetical protein